MPSILMIGEDVGLCQQLRGLLPKASYRLSQVSLRAGALTEFAHWPDLLVADCGSNPGEDPLAAPLALRRSRPGIPVIVIARESSEELAIRALRMGVVDYFKTPTDASEVAGAVTRCLGSRAPDLSAEIIGEDPRMSALRSQLRRVAAANCNVFLSGETGTGKELAAAAIHQTSVRRDKPFVCINCAALPDGLLESELFGYERGAFTGAMSAHAGKLEQADGGTVFFDEIGDMSPFAQAKILRAIETREICPLGGNRPRRVDIRIIAATNRNLEALAQQDRFRTDLLFRLRVAHVHLPPLRERRSDIPLLLHYFLRSLQPAFGPRAATFSEEVLDWLTHYDWPGNVRELRNVVEATLVNLCSERIALSDLPEPFQARPPVTVAGNLDERTRLIEVLLATQWNVSKAARRLHWSRMTVYRKLAKYHVVRGSLFQPAVRQ